MPLCGEVFYPSLEWCAEGAAIYWMTDRKEPIHPAHWRFFPDYTRRIEDAERQQRRRELVALASIGKIELGIRRHEGGVSFVEVITQFIINNETISNLFDICPTEYKKRDGTIISYELPILVNFRQLVHHYAPPPGMEIRIGEDDSPPSPAKDGLVTTPYGLLRVKRWSENDDGLPDAPRPLLLRRDGGGNAGSATADSAVLLGGRDWPLAEPTNTAPMSTSTDDPPESTLMPKRLSDKEAREQYRQLIKPFVAAGTRFSRDFAVEWGKAHGLADDEARIIHREESPADWQKAGPAPNRDERARLMQEARKTWGLKPGKN